MTVDDMIEYIGNEIYSIEMFERIKAALMAGQRMRRYLREEEEFEGHLQCCQDWDAVFKEDV